MQALASRVLRAIGALLILLGLVHLAATPHIPHLLDGCPPEVTGHADGPTVLNHVLVGILLLPLGATTWFASAAGVGDPTWARRTLLVNAAALANLPISLALCMRRPEYYASPLFVVGVGLVGIVSVLAVAAAVVLWRAQPDVR